jgi:hypothetical protein
MYNTAPYRPIPKEKPQRLTTPQPKTPPKGSAINRARMEQARKQLKEKAVRHKRVIMPFQQAPKVVDIKSAQKAKEVRDANLKALHEAKMLADNRARLERERKESARSQTREVPKSQPLSPQERSQLANLEQIYAKMAPNISKLNREGQQKLHSIKYQITFLRNKAQGIDTKPMEQLRRPQPKKTSGFMQRQAQAKQIDLARQAKQIKSKITQAISRNKRGLPNSHRPYAMSKGMGMLTVQKHRQARRLNPTAVESNNMAGLRRYTAAQNARDQRERAEREATADVANLAGAFSHTRAAMERMVR